MHSIWVHSLKTNGLVDSSLKTLHKQVAYVDCCAICRYKLSSLCTNCKERLEDGEKHAEEVLYQMWLSLMMLRNRKDTLFGSLSRDIIRRVFDFAAQGPVAEVYCDVAKLECGHTYHDHCFRRWFQRRNICPLDNRPVTIFSVRTFNMERIAYSGRIVKMFRSEVSYKQVLNDEYAT